MKFFLVVMLVSLAALAAAEEKYTTKYDNIDVEEILKSDRLFNNYFKCFMDQGRCTPDGNEVKRLLPDAMKTECKKCSEAQRRGAERVLKYMLENKKEQFKALQKKYDPDNIYYEKYKPEAEKMGIIVDLY